MPALARWATTDPLLGGDPNQLLEDGKGSYLSVSPYNYSFNNPTNFTDLTGMAPQDDYYIYEDGEVEVERTDDNSDSFYLVDSDGNEQHVGTFAKNEAGLLQLPDEMSIESEGAGSDFGFSVKEGNEYRSFIRGDAFASLIGALSATGTEDLTVVGFSLADGSSPAPSTSHIDGKNGDLRYLRDDESGQPLYLNRNPEDLDAPRQDAFNQALYKYGWKSLLSHTYTLNGQERTPARARHFRNHHHHLHLQGFTPDLVER